MPKALAQALIWLAEQDNYELRGPGNNLPRPVSDLNWLADPSHSSSFAFHGQHGHLTLRQETRPHGSEGYWYAYRNQGHKTLKRYVGRTVDLSIARLEAIAAEFNPALSAHAEQQTRPAPLTLHAPTNKSHMNLSRGKSVPLSQHTPRMPSQQHRLLLAPKLSFPRLSTQLVARETLLTRLDAGLERKLTLLCAPAGFGKTTLAGQWIAHLSLARRNPAVAWVSLDVGDNDPVRFWSYVIAACQALYNEAGSLALAHLHHLEANSFEQAALEVPLTLLINELNQAPTMGMLVLEDYHTINEPRIHASLTFLFEHLPSTLHLVIITRSVPALPLARMRAKGELNELGVDELRLSHEEMSAFLTQTLSVLPAPELIARVNTQIEGWVTGLRLLTLTLRDEASAQSLEQRLASFSGRQRYLLEYFASEILEAQPREIQDFLLQTSMVNSLTASLCDALVRRDDSTSVLESLEENNLFLSPLSGHDRWYRYHPLFVEALRHEAQRRLSPEAWRACYERASAWYEQHGQLSEAIEAALTAQAFGRAAELIEQFTSPQRFHEMHEHYTLQRWLLALPASMLTRHPALCLSFAMTRLFASDCQRVLTADILAQVESPLRMAERAWQAEENRGALGEALAFRVVLARFQGDLACAVRLAHQALAWLPADAWQWRATCLSTIGMDEMSMGELESASQTLLVACSCFEAADNAYGRRAALLLLAEIRSLQGRLRESEVFSQEVLANADEDPADQAQALLGLAKLAYEWNNLESAEARARESLQKGLSIRDERLQIQAGLVLVQIQYARGQTTRVLDLASLLARAQTQASPLLYREILACETLFQLREADLAGAQRWFECEENIPPLYQARESFISARLLNAQGKSVEALALLTLTRDAAQRQGCMRDEIEALVLIALLQPQRDQARFALQEALTLAQAGTYVRLFLDEGEPMAALLRAILLTDEKKRVSASIRALLLAFSRPPREPGTLLAASPIEPLSSQEQRVLDLLVAGFSNAEMAQTLVVSVNTVKTQVQSVYRKLNVHSRREVRQMSRRRNP